MRGEPALAEHILKKDAAKWRKKRWPFSQFSQYYEPNVDFSTHGAYGIVAANTDSESWSLPRVSPPFFVFSSTKSSV